MFCYRDRTFCKFNKCIKFSNKKCTRAFTKQRQEKAESWWTSGGGSIDEMPVCFFVDKPKCFKQ